MNAFHTNRTPGCDCSQYQLEQVGCQCHLVTVLVYPRGYADDQGPKSLVITDAASPHNEAIKAFGPCATVYRVIEPRPLAPLVSREAAMAYTLRDNT
jgi:hypothetical protein